MHRNRLLVAGAMLLGVALSLARAPLRGQTAASGSLTLALPKLKPMDGTVRALRIDRLYVQTADGRFDLPASLTSSAPATTIGTWSNRVTLAGGRTIILTVVRQGPGRARVSLEARPSTGVVRWGFAFDAARDGRIRTSSSRSIARRVRSKAKLLRAMMAMPIATIASPT